MQFISKFVILLLLISLVQAAYSQSGKMWTLEECMQQALSSNISVQQQQLQTKSARADALQSKLNALPTLNAQANNNWQTGFNINPKTNLPEENLAFRTNSFGASANMLVFNGFQSSNTIRMRQSDLQASEFDLQNTQNTIRLNVANAYLRVLQQSEIHEAARIQKTGTQVQLNKQQKLFDLGGLNKSKLLQLKAQLASDELNAINAETQLSQAYLDLWQLINIEPDTAARIAKPDFAAIHSLEDIGTPESIFTDYQNRAPELQAARRRVRSGELQHDIALGGRSPRISFSGSFSSFYTTLNTQYVGSPVSIEKIPIGFDKNFDTVFTARPVYGSTETVPFNSQFKKNLGTSLGFTFTLPIFNGWSVNTNVQKANIAHMNARLNQKQTELNVYKSVTQSYYNFMNALKRYDATEASVNAAKESYEISEKQFELGALGLSDYTLSKNTYAKAMTDFIQAKYELVFRRKVLDFYKGKGL